MECIYLYNNITNREKGIRRRDLVSPVSSSLEEIMPLLKIDANNYRTQCTIAERFGLSREGLFLRCILGDNDYLLPAFSGEPFTPNEFLEQREEKLRCFGMIPSESEQQ